MQLLDIPALQTWQALDSEQQALTLARPASVNSSERLESVQRIITQVRADGDEAIRALTRRFDQVEIDALQVPQAEIEAAEAQLAPDLITAMRNAYRRIREFHRACAPKNVSMDTDVGVRCERISVGIERVGLYVPAGNVPLPSTALMLGVPAELAGCAEVILCSPPDRNGKVHPTVLFAAKLCGITQVFRIGGVQAIAAMAYGSNSVPKCDKLFGPGNAYVTEAKSQVSSDPNGAAIDMPAGPSEVLVIADRDANAEVIAADLLSQAEHGPDSQAIVISDCAPLLEATRLAVARQARELALLWNNSARSEMLTSALRSSRYLLASDLAQALDIANRYASEHLILNVAEPRALLGKVRNAGSVFLGRLTPESTGDYNAGTNHVLPTYGYAKAYSGVSVQSFVKLMTVQELTADGLQTIGPEAVTFARAESLDAHARAVEKRLQLIAQVAPCEQSIATANNDIAQTLCLARPEFSSFRGYSSARMEAKADPSQAQQEKVFLNANESPFLPYADDELGLNRYPEPQPHVLRAELATLYRVTPEQLLIGRGSDELIDLLTRAFGRAYQDSVLIMPPTFGMYKVCAEVQGLRVIELPLRAEHNFVVDFDALLHQVLAPSNCVKLVYFCTPNNPTGDVIERAALFAFLQKLQNRCIVVVDEAYQDFCDTTSCSEWLGEFSNLVILRTLSKGYALAGARAGVALAHPEIIALMRRLMAPYPVPKPVAAAVLKALANREAIQQRIELLIAERNRVVDELSTLRGVRIFPTQANFVVFVVAAPEKVYQQLLAHNIVVREVSHYLNLQGGLRVSIGTTAENQQFLSALRNILNGS